jgi:hypothetical protein
VTEAGWRGRGFCTDQPITDQPIAFRASQPRCGATWASPSSEAIQAATFGLVHSPPRGAAHAGGPGGRRSWRQAVLELVQQVRLQNRRAPAVAAAQVAQRLQALGVVAGPQTLDPASRLRHRGRDRGDVVPFVSCPLARSQIV